MKITKHISFYFLIDRIIYINNIIDETNKYEYTTDIFIHTNNISLEKSMFNKYTNGCITPFNISNAYVLIMAAVLKFPISTKL